MVRDPVAAMNNLVPDLAGRLELVELLLGDLWLGHLSPLRKPPWEVVGGVFQPAGGLRWWVLLLQHCLAPALRPWH